MMKSEWLKRLIVLAALLAPAVSMLGCETTEGAGEDIENLGEGVQDVAE